MDDMKPIKVDDFRQVVKDDGYAQHSMDGKNVVVSGLGTGFWGVVRGTITWMRSFVDGQSVRNENRQVMQSFVEAIRNEYGDHFGEMAMNDLTDAMYKGKYLDARTIRVELEKMDRMEAKLNEVRDLASLYARTDERGSGECFGSILKRVAQEKGIQASLGLVNPDELKQLKGRIYGEIVQLGSDQQVVSEKEAEKIAEKEIEKLLHQKKNVLDRVLEPLDRMIGELSQQKLPDFESGQQLKALKKNRDGLEEFILSTPGLKDAAYVKELFEQSDKVYTFIDQLSKDNVPLNDRLKACGELHEELSKAFKRCMPGTTDHEKDFKVFCSQALQLANKLGAAHSHKAHLKDQTLVHCLEVWQPVGWCLANPGKVSPTSQSKGHEMNLLLGLMASSIGKSGGTQQEEPTQLVELSLGSKGMLGETLQRKIDERNESDIQEKKEDTLKPLSFETVEKKPDWRDVWRQEQIGSMANRQIKPEWSQPLKKAGIELRS